MAKVIVAMSGGVDSAVAAALLIKQGYNVEGLTLQLWHANRTNQKGLESARQVAVQLGIPFHVVDARESFQREIVGAFIASHLANETPNPCVLCNRAVKWAQLINFADAHGAEYVATGHYARIIQTPDGKFELWRASDLAKDQSYVLSNLTQRELQRSIFPLSELRKPEVRAIAQTLGLTVSDTPDSQDLCFVDHEDYPQFLRDYALPPPNLEKSGPPTGSYSASTRGWLFIPSGKGKACLPIAKPCTSLKRNLKVTR